MIEGNAVFKSDARPIDSAHQVAQEPLEEGTPLEKLKWRTIRHNMDSHPMTRQVVKNTRKLAQAGHKAKAESLLKVLEQDPLQTRSRPEKSASAI